jgi:hypothetical protein
MINLVKTPIDTLVLKANDFSYRDIHKLKNIKLDEGDKKRFGPVDIKLVFVWPSGHTETVPTNFELFDIITDGDRDCIIYGECPKKEEEAKPVIEPDYLSYAEQARHREKSGFGM